MIRVGLEINLDLLKMFFVKHLSQFLLCFHVLFNY